MAGNLANASQHPGQLAAVNEIVPRLHFHHVRNALFPTLFVHAHTGERVLIDPFEETQIATLLELIGKSLIWCKKVEENLYLKQL